MTSYFSRVSFPQDEVNHGLEKLRVPEFPLTCVLCSELCCSFLQECHSYTRECRQSGRMSFVHSQESAKGRNVICTLAEVSKSGRMSFVHSRESAKRRNVIRTRAEVGKSDEMSFVHSRKSAKGRNVILTLAKVGKGG